MIKCLLLSVCLVFSSRILAQLPNYVPQDNLQYFWLFNKSDNDLSGKNNTVIPWGVTPTVDRFGNDSFAYLFDGVSDYISANPAVFDSSYSFSMWLQADPAIDLSFAQGKIGSVILSQGARENPACQGHSFVYFFSDVNITNPPKVGELFTARSNAPLTNNCNLNFIGYTDSNTTIIPHLNKWLHLCVTKTYSLDTSKSYTKVYYNGVEVFRQKTGFKDEYVNAQLTIGAEKGNVISTNFKGKIDDVGIWSKSLAACEVAKLYNSLSTFITKDPDNVTVATNGTAIFSISDSITTATYQWLVKVGANFLNVPTSAPFSGTTTKTLTVSPVSTLLNGSEFRCVRFYGVCSDTSDIATLTVNATGVDNLSKAAATIYPNPSNDQINIISNNSQNVKVEISNHIGQRILSEIYNSNNVTIDISSFPEGIYFIKVSDYYTEKVIKK